MPTELGVSSWPGDIDCAAYKAGLDVSLKMHVQHQFIAMPEDVFIGMNRCPTTAV